MMFERTNMIRNSTRTRFGLPVSFCRVFFFSPAMELPHVQWGPPLVPRQPCPVLGGSSGRLSGGIGRRLAWELRPPHRRHIPLSLKGLRILSNHLQAEKSTRSGRGPAETVVRETRAHGKPVPRIASA